MSNRLTRVHENPEAEIVRLQHELRHEMAVNARSACMQVSLSTMLRCGNDWPEIVGAVREMLLENIT